jgi:catechol 2,3-dioxygenase-like lactoylglutathione lyase family enzyme
MLTGAHVLIYTKDAEADRAFFRDVLGFRSVDAGHGWLIFALPAAEAAFHPFEENNKHEMYFMCDDLGALMGVARKERCALRRNRGRAVGNADAHAVAGRRRSWPVPAEASGGVQACR